MVQRNGPERSASSARRRPAKRHSACQLSPGTHDCSSWQAARAIESVVVTSSRWSGLSTLSLRRVRPMRSNEAASERSKQADQKRSAC